MELANIKLLIAYDGKEYLGWQETSMGPSIEGTLKITMEQILQHPVSLQAASRTDAGVHAKEQVVNFFTSKTLDLGKFQTSLNQLLPKDIAVLSCTTVSQSFHPTLNCIGKEYHYFICYGSVQQPHQRFYSWHIHQQLNIENMKKGLPYLIGEHSFISFCNVKKNGKYKDYIRTIEKLEIVETEPGRICIQIKGNNFLYKMVRNIVGTLVDIGKGKLSHEMLPSIIAGESRPLAGVTAPCHGLFLTKIFY